jgi:hypothetical protein
MTDIYSKSLKMKSWLEINLFLILLGLLVVSILSIFSHNFYWLLGNCGTASQYILNNPPYKWLQNVTNL